MHYISEYFYMYTNFKKNQDWFDIFVASDSSSPMETKSPGFEKKKKPDATDAAGIHLKYLAITVMIYENTCAKRFCLS